MAEVKVNLREHSYTIHINPCGIHQVGELMNTLPLGKRVLIVTDENVAPLYADQLADSLKAAGFNSAVIIVEPGESSKSLATADKVFTEAIARGLDRKSPIIALGGGVVGDLAGFVAASYLRGVPLIQVPTSLLAQVDSSVGGKTAVNHKLGKNLIGAFYQPSLVVIDPQVLTSLDDRQLKAGLAEVVKYGVIVDYDLFNYLQNNSAALLARDPAVLTAVISRCCQLKAGVVAQDERETSLRMILNFGHTIGHAVEAEGGYSKYNHGEAVAIGMHGAALISQKLGFCGQADVEALQALLKRLGLPLAAPNYQPEKMLHYLRRDKKVVSGRINWVLMKAIGRVEITTEVPATAIEAVLQQIT
ncbi:3-dehydroquinate synthase [Sporomusa acidovorans]|uniref:3-dehydroquinate synthase n=1 Tax=Sporomusa acidovorans (strain ATCC 49682 / DSM 3132 / Mol) TaxID=1123286 RepID=A0ABZ3J299_SPOA4|nr:3-dehydroquinate synthase [Sporomusa acidovorans]OZC15035.1 3-dehydroquinate synthase [Sporomusa acidovorans DSM 3132]SDE84431.1 3-dehydroquinate synthase [Sporomusa acidovorans]